MQTDKALWRAINAHNLDAADAALPFSARLARDNDWGREFARQAVAEYKRFMYLVCTSGCMLTPSDEVDQVWHLHLLYTEDYWDRFCGEVLKRRIHHGPTKGGLVESDRYAGAYDATLELYRKEFGSEPPPALWPSPTIRFTRPDTYRRIDLSDKIILPKRQVFLCLAVGACLTLTACSAQPLIKVASEHPFPALVVGLLVYGLVSSMFNSRRHRKGKRSDGSGCGGGGCGSSGCSSDSGGDSGGHGCGGSGCGGSGCGGGCGGGGD